jgi:hypothetical protein
MLSIASFKQYFPGAGILEVAESVIVFDAGIFRVWIVLDDMGGIQFEVFSMPPGQTKQLIQKKIDIDSEESCYQEIRTFLLSQQKAIATTLGE